MAHFRSKTVLVCFILIILAVSSISAAKKSKKTKKPAKVSKPAKPSSSSKPTASTKAGKCTGPAPDNKEYEVGKGYIDRCDIFTCAKEGKKYVLKKTFNSTHCCNHDNKSYMLNDMFNSTRLNGTCSTKQLKCVNVTSDFSTPAEIIEIYHHGLCCAYHHRRRTEREYFDEYYNGTILDRNLNFTLYLEIGENVTIPEKCLNMTCVQDSPMGLPTLAMEIVHRSCNCCIYNGTMYEDGHKNITIRMDDGKEENATCCGGQLVTPHRFKYNITNGTKPAEAPAPANGVTLPPPTVPPQADAHCWTSCFKSGNSYHDEFLAIINKLREQQAAKTVKGTCFSLDASLFTTTSSYMYKYQRNIASLLALTLPIDTDNPMFVNKFMNYGACSWYDPKWCCQTEKCSAAKTLAGPTPNSAQPSISTYQPVTRAPYLGMMWHGMSLAHGAFKNTAQLSCAGKTSNEMVIPIVNKQWAQGDGAGGAYQAAVWNGPDGGYGRTVAAIGVDNAVTSQLQAASTSPDLSWKIGSTQDWHNELHSLLTCIDAGCCDGKIAAEVGIPKSFKQPDIVKMGDGNPQ